jgi:hypothetical protein
VAVVAVALAPLTRRELEGQEALSAAPQFMRVALVEPQVLTMERREPLGPKWVGLEPVAVVVEQVKTVPEIAVLVELAALESW